MSARAATAAARRAHGRAVADRAARPRRVSGPARPARPARPRAVPAPAVPAALGPRLLGALRELPDHRLLDRAIRGRAWIVAVGIALIGIVFMQVSMLKLNAGISRAVEHASTLERQNLALTASVAELGAGERIRQEAERLGMVVPEAGKIAYRRAGGGRQVRDALATMRAPGEGAITITNPAAATTETQGTVPSVSPDTPEATPTQSENPATTASAGQTENEGTVPSVSAGGQGENDGTVPSVSSVGAAAPPGG